MTERQLHQSYASEYEEYVKDAFSQDRFELLCSEPVVPRLLTGRQGAQDFLFRAIFFVPQYSRHFNFSGQFIGSKGAGVNNIKAKCSTEDRNDPMIYLSENGAGSEPTHSDYDHSVRYHSERDHPVREKTISVTVCSNYPAVFL